MCAAGGPADAVRADDTDDAGGRLRTMLAGLVVRVPVVGAALDDLDHAYPWAMRDARAAERVRGRIARLRRRRGRVLAHGGRRRLERDARRGGSRRRALRADATTVPLALELYEQRCRSIVERNQTDSRRLARAMFVDRTPLAWVRDQVVRRYPAERMVGQIIAYMHRSF